MNLVNAIGFLGSLISGYAYIPQIYHLVREKCTLGISQKAFGLWLVSSVLLLINALAIASPVFIFLSSMQTVATSIIFFFTIHYGENVCSYHRHHLKADIEIANREMERARKKNKNSL